MTPTKTLSSTRHVHSACDVCGRNLLRGENADTYIAGGVRRQVCDLCAVRALHSGWVRENESLKLVTGARRPRRRSLWERLRGQGARSEREPSAVRGSDRSSVPEVDSERPNSLELEIERSRSVAKGETLSLSGRAVAAFNASDFPRSVAGITRSLGLPEVVVTESADGSTSVDILIAWELSWYRYAVDLSGGLPLVELSDRGTELEQLGALIGNAACDDLGNLALTDE